jgi:hypothetical protein
LTGLAGWPGGAIGFELAKPLLVAGLGLTGWLVCRVMRLASNSQNRCWWPGWAWPGGAIGFEGVNPVAVARLGVTRVVKLASNSQIRWRPGAIGIQVFKERRARGKRWRLPRRPGPNR